MTTSYTPEELTEAETLDSENRNDALHAILAHKHRAKYVVTRNIKHLNKFKHLIAPILPEEL